MANIRPFRGQAPKIASPSFLADDCNVIGDVEIADHVSLWYQTTLRGDVNAIRIGAWSNIQDGSVIHCNGEPSHPTLVGSYVTVGHGAVLHGCRIEDETLIGIRATLLNGCVIEKHAMVAAGAVVREGQVVASGTLVAGVPAKVIRHLSAEEIAHIRQLAVHYWNDLASHA